MNLYLCEAGGTGYDEYDEIVVRAESPGAALKMVTEGYNDVFWKELSLNDPIRAEREPFPGFSADGSNVTVTEIPLGGEPEFICTSFNAG